LALWPEDAALGCDDGLPADVECDLANQFRRVTKGDPNVEFVAGDVPAGILF
jgi:hypothetical protein